MAPDARGLRRRSRRGSRAPANPGAAAAWLTLAESALAAPFAGFGDPDAYPSLELKAAILLERLVRNHPLPDGNKRTGLAVAIRFLERNGRLWGEPATSVDVDMVRRVAARTVKIEEMVAWIGQRTEQPD